MKKQLTDNRGGGFTQQVKISLPRHYVHKIDSVSSRMGIPRRFVIWDALGNYLLQFNGGNRQAGGRS
jgi:metal-responsive CopG/Arc/MetJ family transcriptional regulator